jgi:hypothetical protein
MAKQAFFSMNKQSIAILNAVASFEEWNEFLSVRDSSPCVEVWS